MNKLVMSLTILIMATLGFGLIVPAHASAAVDDGCHKSGGFFGFPTWYEYLDIGPKTHNITDKDGKILSTDVDPCAIIGPADTTPAGTEFSWEKALPRVALAIIDIMLRVVGVVAIVFITYGGFQYITSQAEPEALKKARSTVMNALIGMAIAILATAFVSFLGETLWK